MIGGGGRGQMADSQLIGINYLHHYGISAQFLETRGMNLLRRINFNLAQLPTLWRIRNYDILFLNSNLLFVFLVKRVLRYKKPKIVFYNTFFTNTLKRNTHGFYARLIRRAIASIDMIVCPSTAQKNILVQEGFDAKHIVVVLNGVDEKFFAPSKRESNTQQFSILSVGKDMGRDYRTLIEAVRGSDVSITIIAAPRNLKGIAGIPENVKILFDVPQKETRDFYAKADIVVVPTFSENHWDASDCSGQYVILESMAAGKTVVASERSTLSDYIQNQKNGLFVKGEDPVLLRNVIEMCSRNPALLESLSIEARKTIEAHCTTKKLAESLSIIFKKIA